MNERTSGNDFTQNMIFAVSFLVGFCAFALIAAFLLGPLPARAGNLSDGYPRFMSLEQMAHVDAASFSGALAVHPLYGDILVDRATADTSIAFCMTGSAASKFADLTELGFVRATAVLSDTGIQISGWVNLGAEKALFTTRVGDETCLLGLVDFARNEV